MTNRIKVRPARPDDAPLAAAVFRLSLGAFGEYLMGRDGRVAEITYMRLFSSDAGRFGYSLAHVVELNRRPLGLLLSFPAADLTRLNLSIIKHLPRSFGWSAFGFLSRALAYAHIHEAEADEYYISAIGVLSATQKYGLGKRLLLYADELARRRKLKKISLMVALENQAAQRFFKHNGYKIVFTKNDKNPFASYHRMVKKIW